MSKCIYCLREDVCFARKEHVVSQLLGTFLPPLFFKGDIVCDSCNNIFSGLETLFAEDSLEGRMSALLDSRGRRSIRHRGERFKLEVSVDSSFGFLKDFFKFVNPYAPELKPMIIMRNRRKSYQAIFPEELEKLSENSGKFKRKKSWLSTLDQKDIKILGNEDFPVKRSIAILKRYGINYKESRSLFLPEKMFQVQLRANGRVDIKICCYVAKIAFNFFAFCARESGYKYFLYENHFDPIRNFILRGVGQNPVTLSRDTILEDEKDWANRHIIHLLTFRQENGNIIAEISLTGFLKYTIIIAPYFFKIGDPRRFGCGISLNPLTHKIGILYPQYGRKVIYYVPRNKFAVFRR